MRHVTAEQRRTRLARRQRTAAETRAGSAEEATRSLFCLHGTDPSTIYLSVWARVDDFSTADLDRALYTDRTLIKHLAMRRTLFVFPRDDLAAVQAGSSERVADQQRRHLIKDVEKAELYPDGDRWLTQAKIAVLDALADGREASWKELRDQLPILSGKIRYGEGRSWGGEQPVGPRVLTVLSAEGKIVRGTNRGGWTVSRPSWATMESWLGAPLDQPNPEEGHRRLVEGWLRSFGPGTLQDIKWWLGSTVAAVKTSLADLDAVEVDLDSRPGFVLPDDQEPDEPVEPWVALLPALDPTTMGWSDRDWYLGDHRALLFDTAGNAGPTVWADGRIIGGWWQNPDGELVVHLLENVDGDTAAALDAEAARLTTWLDGRVVMPRFPSPLAKAVSEGISRAKTSDHIS
jgi:hypothetical protein